jgi:hypothetical protein
MKLASRVASVIGIAVAVALSGCGKAQKPTTAPPVPETDVPLPDWAPENPSPEFLRAASVLKPLPAEWMAAVAQGDQTRAAFVEKFSRTWSASYEFFGTLTDDQIKRVLSVGQIRIPVKDLSAKQKAALDTWFSTWRRAMKGTELDDFLVDLYKAGAKDDLSNVEVGFDVPSRHMVHVKFWVKQSDGSEQPLCAEFALL